MASVSLSCGRRLARSAHLFRPAGARAALHGSHDATPRAAKFAMVARKRRRHLVRPTRRRETSPPRGVQGGLHMTVSRRNFARLSAASAASAAAAAVASPSVAQSPTIKWRLASSLPQAIENLWGAAPTVAKFVSEMSDGKFMIDSFAAGEIVPGLQVLDACANGTGEWGHTYSGSYIGKNPALIFDGSLPFGLTPRQHHAWYLFGEGKKLVDEVYDGMGVVSLSMGNTGGQTFGWFRKEIKTPADLHGGKMRGAGFSGGGVAQ